VLNVIVGPLFELSVTSHAAAWTSDSDTPIAANAKATVRMKFRQPRQALDPRNCVHGAAATPRVKNENKTSPTPRQRFRNNDRCNLLV
jgi:hypothetical protein